MDCNFGLSLFRCLTWSLTSLLFCWLNRFVYSLRFVNVKMARQCDKRSQEILKMHKLNFVTGYFYSASMNLFINVVNLSRHLSHIGLSGRSSINPSFNGGKKTAKMYMS
jgi:hypothetical protein